MLSKEVFIQAMTSARNQYDYELRASYALKTVFPNSVTPCVESGHLWEAFALLLADGMECPHDIDTINWWMFETNFGRDKELAYIIINGNKHSVATIPEFYDCLNYLKTKA